MSSRLVARAAVSSSPRSSRPPPSAASRSGRAPTPRPPRRRSPGPDPAADQQYQRRHRRTRRRPASADRRSRRRGPPSPCRTPATCPARVAQGADPGQYRPHVPADHVPPVSAGVAVPDGSRSPGQRRIPGSDISQTVVRFYPPAMTFLGTATPGKAENPRHFTAAPPDGDHVPAATALSSPSDSRMICGRPAGTVA